MIIEGLMLYGSSEGKALAKVIAHRWIETNFVVYSETSHMLEKYDATVCGGTGRGGEYQLQVNGNAVIMIDSIIRTPKGILDIKNSIVYACC